MDSGEWDHHGQVWLEQGTKAWETGQHEEATQFFNRIVDRYPNRPEGYNKLGVIYAEMGQHEYAEKYFLYALSKETLHVPALTNLGNVYLERGEIDEAIKHYTLALQTDPEYPPAHRNLAIAYRRLGRIGPSVRHLKRSQWLETRERVSADQPLSGDTRTQPFWQVIFRRPGIWLVLAALLILWVIGWGIH